MSCFFPEDPDKKATSLFRTQLLTPNPGGSKAGLGGMNYPDEHRVNIVQKEPRVSLYRKLGIFCVGFIFADAKFREAKTLEKWGNDSCHLLM